MIKELSNAYGPSAAEEEVRKIIIRDLSDFYSDIKIDNLGNLIIHKPGNKKSIAITAPMDEVSFLVTHEKNKEILIVTSICNVKSNTLQNILLMDKNNNNYIVNKIPKNTDVIEKIKNIEILNVDKCKVYRLDNEFVSKLLVYDKNIKENDDFYIGKALERSVCCSILCDVARTVANSLYEYYFIFSTQNYCDKKGSLTATFNLKIDELYNLCCVDTEQDDVKMEKGPVMILRDKMLISNNDLINSFDKTLPIQKLISSNLICEGGYFQRQHTTKKIISIGIPINFKDCFNEVVSKNDIKNFKSLILEKVLP